MHNIADGIYVPELEGRGTLPACHEIHTFLGPVLTDATMNDYGQVVGKYKAVVAKWNAEQLPFLQQRDKTVKHVEMKAPVLTLVFRDGQAENPVTVCQSARYVFCNDMGKVLKLCDEDAEFFAAQGLQIVRKKVEASAHGIAGVPQTMQEALAYPHLYFEFHIKVQHQDASVPNVPVPMSDAEQVELRSLANVLSAQLNRPIPLSYNREKNEGNLDNGGCQRFLNVRFYNEGMQEIAPKLAAITQAIESTGAYKVLKTISEYVWFDTNKAMDHGWIEYTREELTALMQRLNGGLDVQGAMANFAQTFKV
jgi:hypothetical protein